MRGAPAEAFGCVALLYGGGAFSLGVYVRQNCSRLQMGLRQPLEGLGVVLARFRQSEDWTVSPI